MCPDVHDLVVTLARGDDTLAILLLDFADLLLRRGDFLALFLRDDHVIDADGNARAGGLAEAEFLEPVQHDHGLLVAADLVTFPDQVAQFGLADHLVRETHFSGPDFAEDDAADGGVDDSLFGVAVLGLDAEVGIRHADALMGFHRAVGVGENNLVLVAKQFHRAGGGGVGARFGGDVVTAQRDVLRGRDDRLAARRAEDVVRGHHQHARFHLRLDRQRHVDGHLVAVEIRVVGGANQRMNPDGFALDENRLEGLHRQPVQRRRAIEQHRVALGDFLKDVPDFRRLALDHFLGRADGMDVAQFLRGGG